MNQLVTIGIVLARTDYGEADRILTLLTPDYGKVRLMAKGVRRIKSKLAGGIELFSISNVTFIQSRSARVGYSGGHSDGQFGGQASGLSTLISTRLIKYYSSIVKDINRTMLGYDLIKMLNKATEDEPEPDYFELLEQAFEALDDATIALPLIRLWFAMQLLRIGGHAPNLKTDTTGAKLMADQTYNLSFDDMAFAPAGLSGSSGRARFSANQIKFLRLGFAGHQPKALAHIHDNHVVVDDLMPVVQTMLQTYIRI